MSTASKAKTKKTTRRTASSWPDVTGKHFAPGDIVAISIINDRSPQTVVARVEEIFLDDSKGEPYVDGQYVRATNSHRKWQSCSVLAAPLVDSRGFNRYSDRKVSYKIPDNIIKLDVTEEQLQQAHEEREQRRSQSQP